MKILNIPDQSNALTNEMGGYFFYDPFMLAARDGRITKPVDQWTELQKTEVRDAFQKGLDSLEEWSTRAKDDNKIMIAKEHAFWFVNPAAFHQGYNGADGVSDDFSCLRPRIPDTYGSSKTFSPKNQTILTDEYLRSWRIALIIRHPALTFPSFYRAMCKITAVGFIGTDGLQATMITNMTLRWTRMLFDWCLEQPDVPAAPLLLDASDVIHNPQAVMRFCELAGLDPNAIQFGWDATVEQKSADNPNAQSANVEKGDMDKVAASIMLSTLHSSSGIVKDKAPATVDIPTEAVKWKKEFGEEAAATIENAVWSAMPDYDYLKARRVTA